MNAQQLFTKNDKGELKGQDIWFCSACKKMPTYMPTKEKAEECCTPKQCNKCPEMLPVNHYRTVCNSCHSSAISEKRVRDHQITLDNADEVTSLKEVPHDMYFDDVDNRYLTADDIHGADEFDELPDWLFLTSKRSFGGLDMREAVQNLMENDFSNADGEDLIHISNEEYEEVQEAVDKWCASIDQHVFVPDVSRKISLATLRRELGCG